MVNAPRLERARIEIGRRRGRPVGTSKVQKTIRLDADMVDALMADGPGWQTHLNALLRKALMLDQTANR